MPCHPSRLRVLCAVAASAALVVTSNGALNAQDSIVRRPRSSVLLRSPTVEATQLPVTRPSTARPPSAVAPITTSPARATALMRAAQPVQTEGAGLSPQEAATNIATRLYGNSAQLNTVTVLRPNLATVWVGDTARLEAAPPGLDVAEGVVLPFRYIGVDEATGEVMALKPWFDDGGGLRYNSRQGAYVATLRIGLRDTLSAMTARRTLSPAIRLSIGAVADSIDPELLEVTETNVFTTRARLVTSRVPGPMRVTVWPDFAPRGIELWIPVVPDSVLLRVDRRAIDGFGLAVANVTVQMSPGALAPSDSMAVTLQSARGAEFIDGPVVWPKGNTPAMARVRSTGMGVDTIIAFAGPLVAGREPISFAFPSGLFFGGLFGALIGSALAVMRLRKRVQRKNLAVFFASGALTGLVLALGAALGVLKIPGLELASGGAALVSLLAGVLGGYIGPEGLERMVPGFGSGRAAPAPPAA